jgi:hypothetical protein
MIRTPRAIGVILRSRAGNRAWKRISARLSAAAFGRRAGAVSFRSVKRFPAALPLLVAALFSPALCQARPVVRPAPEGAIRWRLAEGAVEAGGTLEVGWESRVLSPEAREWELFLSLDGGRSYPLRLTPHLSAASRSTVVRLPPVESPDARLLLRVGDERLEWAAEAPLPLILVRSGRTSSEPPIPVFGRGETALDGTSETVEWEDSAGRRRVSMPGGSVSREDRVGGETREDAAEPPPAAAELPGPRAGGKAVSEVERSREASRSPDFSALPPLLATCRRNT